MKIETKKLPQSQIELKIEVPAQEFQAFKEKAILELAKNLEMEGFRKGHVPKEMAERQIGQEKILAQAAESCIKENYLKAVDENKIEPLGQPKVEILKMALGNPLEFKATVSVMPEIKMPDYRKIASSVQKKEVKVTDAEIAKLKEEKERKEKERVRQEILEKVGEKAEIEIPPVLIESEQQRMLENLKQQVSQMLQMTFEDYLKKVGKTEKELLDSLKPEAEKKVRNSLVLRGISKEENLSATEEEIKAETEKILTQYPQASQLDRERLKEYTKEVIRNEKAFQLLEQLALKP